MENAIRDELSYFLYNHPGIKETLNIIGQSVCYPCIRCYLFCGGRSRYKCGTWRINAAQRKQERMVVIAYEHEARKPKLFGRYSLSSDEPRSLRSKLFSKQTSNQGQSPLLSKLPAEIRLQIWEDVVDIARTVHIYRTSFGNRRYRRPKLMSCSCEHPHTTHTAGPECTTESRPQARGIVPLLQTCRKTYTEMIPIVFGKSRFAFKHTHRFRMFLAVTPKLNLERIRALTLPLLHNNPRSGKGGEMMMETLRSLKGLRTLCFPWRIHILDVTTNENPSFHENSAVRTYIDVRSALPVRCRMFFVQDLLSLSHTIYTPYQWRSEPNSVPLEPGDEETQMPIVVELLSQPSGTLVKLDVPPFEIVPGRCWPPGPMGHDLYYQTY
ncbi:hypothetical protein B0J11DRAFT_35839 [Dendryphion nanum]|uniref:DUF7730 domain-containing protein n=1 Tax=Dendryphion nanum TaxID=256645 RepID=A0A9P9J2N3_9PLEO|nr:hypothetical protein B0J11DRAFT_35839 [Dendryphion nanum]